MCRTCALSAWPTPTTFAEADGLFTTWGYEDSVLLSAPLREPAAGRSSDSGDLSAAMLRAHVRVLVCRTQCVPAEFELESPLQLDLPAATQRRIDARFDEARAKWPRSAANAGVELQARWQSHSATEPAPADEARLLLEIATCRPDEAAVAGVTCAQFAELHRDIIAEFGRFPHRNTVLGRESTPEEIAFLAEDPRAYGQGGKKAEEQS